MHDTSDKALDDPQEEAKPTTKNEPTTDPINKKTRIEKVDQGKGGSEEKEKTHSKDSENEEIWSLGNPTGNRYRRFASFQKISGLKPNERQKRRPSDFGLKRPRR